MGQVPAPTAGDEALAPEVRELVESYREAERVAIGPAPTEDDLYDFVGLAQQLTDLPADRRPAWADPEGLMAHAAEICRAHGDYEDEAVAQQVLSDRNIAAGRLSEERERLRAVVERLGTTWNTPVLRLNLADIARLRGSWTEAQEEVDAARTVLAALPQDNDDQSRARRAGIALADGCEGQLDLDLGLLDQAWTCFERMKRASDALGDPTLDKACTIYRGNMALALEDHGGLERLVEAALQRDGWLPSERALLELLRAISLSERARSEPGVMDDAIAAAHAAADPAILQQPSQVDAVQLLADLALRSRRPDEAEAFLETSRELLRSGLAGIDFARSVPQAARQEVLESRLDRARGTGPAELERHLASLERAYDAFLRQWSDTPVREGGVGFLQFGERRAVLGELVALLVALRGPNEGANAALEHLLRAQDEGTLARRLPGATPTLEEIRERVLGPGAGALVYLRLRSRPG